MTEEQRQKTKNQIKNLKVMCNTTKVLIKILENMLKENEENIQE